MTLEKDQALASVREEEENLHDHDHGETSCCAIPEDNSEMLANLEIPDTHTHDIIYIKEMDCPMESALIENVLKDQTAILEIYFNYLKREAHIIHDGDITPMLEKIRAINMTPIVVTDGQSREVEKTLYEKYETPRLILSGISAAMAEVAHFAGWSTLFSALFAFISIALVGLTTYKKGWIALKNRTLNINALMSVAVTGAILLGEFPEAAMVIFLFTLSELIEAKSLTKAQNAVEKLLHLAPDVALVVNENGVEERPLERVEKGDTIRVVPGGRLPLDGVIIRGASSFDESPITGESLPVDKSVDQIVYAGSINQQGEIDYRATTTAENSTLAKIVRTIEEAQGKRAPVERFIDRFAAIYTPVVFLVGIVIALLSPFFGVSWYQSIYNALVVLIIACPCALVISTPVAVVSALTLLARHGILVKGGEYIEKGASLTHLAFDKTGTLTQGAPKLTEVIPMHAAFEEEHSLAMPYAMNLAGRSDHPISRAIVRDYGGQSFEVENFTAIPGQGVMGEIDGEHLYLGNRTLMMEKGIDLSGADAAIKAVETSGASLSIFAKGREVMALFVVSDPLKKGVKEALKSLKDRGLMPILLSGDHEGAVNHVAREVGITEAHGELLPEDKTAILRSHQVAKGKGTDGQSVGMIGDGINDAPALATADVGFAMGAIGSDVAIETANVAIMDDDLRKLPTFFGVSQKTLSIIKQNITLALGIKLVFFIAVLLGHGSMWGAVFADVGASIIVILNSLRALRFKE